MTALETILKQFAMNTRLYRNTLDGVSEEQGLQRPDEHTNHLRWIAGHLLVSRYSFPIRLGLHQEPYPHVEKYKLKDTPPPGNRPLDNNIEYPSLAETLHYWDLYSVNFIKGISSMTEEQLVSENGFQTPIYDNSMQGTIAFIAMHEAYHIGQMSLIRKSLGLKSTVLM